MSVHVGFIPLGDADAVTSEASGVSSPLAETVKAHPSFTSPFFNAWKRELQTVALSVDDEGL